MISKLKVNIQNVVSFQLLIFLVKILFIVYLVVCYICILYFQLKLKFQVFFAKVQLILLFDVIFGFRN